MNTNEIFNKIVAIFKTKKINFKLQLKLEQQSHTDDKDLIKLYLFQFLLDQTNKTASIYDINDIWFIKERAANIDLINKYILLFENVMKRNDIFNIDIIKEIEPFFDSDIGTKIIYIISILNKFNLPNIIILLFLGFLIGEKKDFIKENYKKNIKDLLKSIGSEIDFSLISSNSYIYSLNESMLEKLNIYFFFLKFLNKEKKYIYSQT